MDSISKFLQNGWTSVVGFFGPMSLGETLNVVFFGFLAALVLFQIVVHHSSRRYYKLLVAIGVALGSGYGAFIGLTKYVLPELTFLSPTDRPVIAAIAATLVSLVAVYYLSRRILGDKPRGSRQQRRHGQENLAMETGDFGNTRAGSADPNWTSNRGLLDEIIDSYRPDGKIPTNPQVDAEAMLRRDIRDKRKTS